jgi:hypothetical protein|tara:strand:+ start:1931 stop:2254 length:324 start_codon:yes stop_codon:yes gene_type:complete
MEETKVLDNLIKLVEEKYEPILVVQLLRVPPEAELRAFAQKLMNDFGYKVLILPGDVETKVELISVMKSDVKKVEDLQSRVLDLVKTLEEEYKDILSPVRSGSDEPQ